MIRINENKGWSKVNRYDVVECFIVLTSTTTMLRRLQARPLRRLPNARPPSSQRLLSTLPESTERTSGSFYIANVFPMKLAYWDPRPWLATLREENIMERLSEIGSEIQGHGFRIESWEIARKDGGVFLHFSYVPPVETEAEKDEEKKLETITALPTQTGSPGKLFIPQILEASKKHGGIPSWLGQWYAQKWESKNNVPGHVIYQADAEPGEIKWRAGMDRIWVVKGRQWTEVGGCLTYSPTGTDR